MLQQIFIDLTQRYTSDIRLSEKLWEEIETNYYTKKRHYHTLNHLENLLNQLTLVKNQIEDWDTILFSLFYHDVIYKATSSENEEKSAEFGKNRLQLLGFPTDKINKCITQILETKGHSKSVDNDTNFFTDADLSILGQSWETYSEYYKQVRREYAIYPDFMYNPGRKKVLNHFLKMERIFKTKLFFDKFENQARQNLMEELKNS